MIQVVSVFQFGNSPSILQWLFCIWCHYIITLKLVSQGPQNTCWDSFNFFLVGIAQKLQIKLGKTVILTIFSLVIKKCGISLHLFSSFWFYWESYYILIKYDVSFGFFEDMLSQVEDIPLYSSFTENFYCKRALYFVKCFFSISWFGPLIFLL